MSKNKILFVIGSLDLGGAERHLALIASRLKRLGWEPSIYCIRNVGTQANEVESSGVKVIGPPWRAGARKSKLSRIVHVFASCLKLLKVLVSDRPYIGHFFLPLAYVVGAPLSVVSRVPILVMSRRSLNYYQDQHPFLAKLEYFLHGRMDAILCNSRAIFAQLIDEGCPRDRLRVVYNGIDLEIIDRAKKEQFTRPFDGLILVMIANLIRYKGHHNVIAGLAKVKSQMPAKWKLYCIGRDDGLRRELESLAVDSGLQNNIEFVGEQPDTARWTINADIGVLCSHEEGFSNAILECMAAGLPMVVTNVGGNPECVLHDKNGYVVPPRDTDAIGQAILKLANEPDLRRRMGHAARQRVEHNFHIARCVEEYDRVYRELEARQ